MAAQVLTTQNLFKSHMQAEISWVVFCSEV